MIQLLHERTLLTSLASDRSARVIKIWLAQFVTGFLLYLLVCVLYITAVSLPLEKQATKVLNVTTTAIEGSLTVSKISNTHAFKTAQVILAAQWMTLVGLTH